MDHFDDAGSSMPMPFMVSWFRDFLPQVGHGYRTRWFGGLLLLMLGLSSGGLQAEPIYFSKTGYAIKLLDAGPVSSGSQTTLQMFLPVREGFASNVNVQHQAFEGTLQDYVALTQAQFEQRGWTLVDETLGTHDYSAKGCGQLGASNLILHVYFRAVKSGDTVILATATAPQSRWEEEFVLLKPIVDSLESRQHSQIK